MDYFYRAEELLKEFKQGKYNFGFRVLSRVGGICRSLGRRAVLIRSGFSGINGLVDEIKQSLEENDVELISEIGSPRPNAPDEDVYRISDEISKANPDVLISFGGGSNIDAVKAADVLVTLGGEIEDYFGTGIVTEKQNKSGKKLIAHIAIQTAASSASHLTKYSNVTNLKTNQKKLIVDDAIVPQYPVFDYRATETAPMDLTKDGALDGISHIVEVLYGAEGKPVFDRMTEIAETGISLILKYLPGVIKDPGSPKAREALCLGTDLGGYAIMIGGTNGGHLTSFSLVDVLSHGRACAIVNPYYTVFFSSAIEKSLKLLGRIYKENGFIDRDMEGLTPREMGEEVARGMLNFAKSIGFPTSLNQVDGFTDGHIERALNAAKDPQLKMKLENMPVPLSADMIDEYMKPILVAAKTGDLSLIKSF